MSLPTAVDFASLQRAFASIGYRGEPTVQSLTVVTAEDGGHELVAVAIDGTEHRSRIVCLPDGEAYR